MMDNRYIIQGNFKKAYEYQSKAKKISDEIINEETTRAQEEMKTKYESEKKDAEIKLQETELEAANAKDIKQRAIMLAELAGGIFAILA